MKLTDLDPQQLADQAHDFVLARCQRLAFALGYDLVEGGAGVSDVRWAVRQLAHYARTGEPPEGRRELVHEYLISLVGVDLVPEDLDPGDEPEGDPTERAVHLVVLAVLARERLADDEPVPTAWLAALASTQPSYVRRLVSSGELRTWKRGVTDKRTHVHPEDAKRWLESRRSS